MSEEKSSEIGYILKNARIDKGYTLRELGEKSSITYSYISAVERGMFLPSREKLIKLANALELNTDDLLVLAGYSPVDKEEVKSTLSSYIFSSGNRYSLEGLSERIFLERYASKDWDLYFDKPKPVEKTNSPNFNENELYYTVQDYTMEGEGIKPGYRVVIDKSIGFKSGKIVLIKVKGKEYLRRVFEENDKYIAQGTGGIAPKIYRKKGIKIIGQAIRVEFDLD